MARRRPTGGVRKLGRTARTVHEGAAPASVGAPAPQVMPPAQHVASVPDEPGCDGGEGEAERKVEDADEH